MDRLAVRLFGKPALTFDGKPLKWKAPPKTLPLLATLALHRGPALARRALAAALWPDELESEGLTRLRRHVYHIAHSLPSVPGVEWLVSTRESVSWNDAAPAWFDVLAFRDAVERERIYDVIELYRGDLLEGSYDEVVLDEREHMRAGYLNALTRATREHREARTYATAIDYAEKLLMLDEWNEEAVRELMAAKYESGDRSAALATYERFARKLQAELSASPSQETTSVRDAIRGGLAPAPSPAKTPQADEGYAPPRGWKLPFVGRDAELQKLGAAWSRAARGSGTAAFLSGEAGIGKSRLALELASRVRGEGGQVLVGTTSQPENEPYHPLLVALRPLAPQIARAPIEPVWLSALARVLPELHSLRDDLFEDELPPERAAHRLFEAVARAIEFVARVGPLCIVLEDLQWAGSATLELLAAIVRRIGTLPVIVVATSRSGEMGPDATLHRLRSALVAERRALVVPLERLSDDDVTRLVRSVENSDERLAGAVAELSGGNPLFAAQLVEAYRETGVLPDASPALETVGDAISARGRRLDAPARAVAEAASMLGETFRADVVADICGWSEEQVLDAIELLGERGILREGGGTLEHAFTHALFATAFYSEMPPNVLAARHRRAAGVLTSLYGDDRAGAASIARHWKLGGERERASAAFVNASRAANAVYAGQDAIAYAREALALTSDAGRRFSALLLVTEAQRRLARPEERLAVLDELQDVASALGAREQFQSEQRRILYNADIGDRTTQRARAERMLALSDQLEPASRGQALRSLGSINYVEGRLLDTLAVLQEAVGIAGAQGMARDEVMSRETLLRAFLRLGRPADAELQLQQIESIAAANAGLSELRARLLVAKCFFAIETGNPRLAMDSGAEMLEYAKRIGDTRLEAEAYSCLAVGALRHAKVGDVRAYFAAGTAVCDRMGWPAMANANNLNLATFELGLGRSERALAMYDELLPSIERAGAAFGTFEATVRRAETLLLLGRTGEALAAAGELQERAFSSGARSIGAAAQLIRAKATFAAGDRDGGLALLYETLAIRREIGPPAALIETLQACAAALFSLGRIDAARPLANELHELYRRHPQADFRPIEVLHTLSAIAAACGDESSARTLNAEARDALARELARFDADDDEGRAAFCALPYNREPSPFYDDTSNARVLG